MALYWVGEGSMRRVCIRSYVRVDDDGDLGFLTVAHEMHPGCFNEVSPREVSLPT